VRRAVGNRRSPRVPGGRRRSRWPVRHSALPADSGLRCGRFRPTPGRWTPSPATRVCLQRPWCSRPPRHPPAAPTPSSGRPARRRAPKRRPQDLQRLAGEDGDDGERARVQPGHRIVGRLAARGESVGAQGGKIDAGQQHRLAVAAGSDHQLAAGITVAGAARPQNHRQCGGQQRRGQPAGFAPSALRPVSLRQPEPPPWPPPRRRACPAGSGQSGRARGRR